MLTLEAGQYFQVNINPVDEGFSRRLEASHQLAHHDLIATDSNAGNVRLFKAARQLALAVLRSYNRLQMSYHECPFPSLARSLGWPACQSGRQLRR